jgi:hypothetical protein
MAADSLLDSVAFFALMLASVSVCLPSDVLLCWPVFAKVNIGPRPLLSSQCITIFQHYLDMEMDRQGLKQKA